MAVSRTMLLAHLVSKIKIKIKITKLHHHHQVHRTSHYCLISFFCTEKSQWVAELYQAFVQLHCHEKPFPLKADTIVRFVRWCAKSASYAHSTIYSVIIPSLKRLHCMHMKVDMIPLDIKRAMQNVYAFVKRAYPHLAQVQSRAPCTTRDIEHIINSTPKGDCGKAEQASCWLTAGQTGARVVTMAHVTVGDIVSVRPSSRKGPDGNPMLLTKIMFNVTKGNRHWHHKVSLEGQTSVESGCDAVFWLEKHLLSSVGLSLHKHSEWQLSPELQKRKMWHWNVDAMSAAFKTACELAGFPSELFSFHSLRAGFICSAVIEEALKQGDVSDSAKHAIMEATAFVAGWKPNGPAQQGYIKDVLKSNLIASRLVSSGVNGAEPANGKIDSNSLAPAAFHDLPSPPTAKYSIYRNWEALNAKLEALIFPPNASQPVVDLASREGLRQHCLNYALQAYGSRRESIVDAAAAKAKTYKGWCTSRHSSLCLKARVTLSREHIAQCLATDFEATFDNVYGELSLDILHARDVKRYKQLQPTVDCKTRGEAKVKYTRGLIPRAKNDKGSRKRKIWSEDETKKLTDLYALHGNSWLQIAQHIPDRSPQDCRDKYRILKKR